MWGVCSDFRCKNCFHKSQNRISTVLKYLKQPLSVITSILCSIIQRYILFSLCRTNWIKDFKLTKTDLLLQQRNKDGDHMVLIGDLVFLPETLRSSIKALQFSIKVLVRGQCIAARLVFNGWTLLCVLRTTRLD